MNVSGNYYDPAKEFVSPEVSEKFKSLGFESYYDVLKESDQLKLLDLHNSQPLITFKKLVKRINTEGTISPSGPIINTPSKISVELKPHQKRTLYEMLQKENSKYRYSSGWNVNLLCDNVGSGKSLCILSLIAQQPMASLKGELYYSGIRSGSTGTQWFGQNYELQSTVGFSENAIELESNLIVVPHNIFLQWKEYITRYTKIKTFFIKGKKDYTKFCESKESVIKYCKENDIILIKSTMYKKFYNMLNIALLGIDNDYTVATTSLKQVSNMSNVSDPTIQLRYKMRQIKADMYSNYTDFHKVLGSTNTNDEKQEVRTKFKKLISELTNIVDDYDWNELGKDIHKKITPYQNRVQLYYFQRVIVDEVDSIKIPAFPYIYSKQIWYISSSINNIIYPYGNKQYQHASGTYKTISSGIPGTGFLKEILATMFRSASWSHKIRLDTFRGLFCIVRNNNSFIEHSIHIPAPIINMIECYTPPHLHALKNAIDTDALKAFNAGDTKKAIEILGCKGGTEEDLINQITEKLETKQKDLEKKITIKAQENAEATVKITNLKQHLENPDCDAFAISLFDAELETTKKTIKNNRVIIKSSKEQISSLKSKINGIKERLADVESKKCPICYSPFVEPSITPCCNNIFCLECITMSISSSVKKECPLCRTKIALKDVNLIINNPGEPASPEKVPKLLSKTKNLLKLIKEKPEKRIMIFSEYESTLRQIRDELDEIDIKYSGIKGAGSTVQNIINKFKDRQFNVLLLNAKYFGAGLNLQFTDEIIIYHRMSKDLETQVIGRAQRLGRSDPLKINYLCYDNEYQ